MLSAILCGDILAIRCVNKYVCVGVGNCVNVYEIGSREIVAKLKIFEHDNIHSIVRGPANELFIYGGRNLSICELVLTSDRVKLNLRSVCRFDDWIIALGWSRDDHTTILSILFAHNNLRFYDASNKINQNVWCQERCILYGGSVLSKKTGETIVFSGTVFREILIWQAKNNGDCANDATILHRLKGHKGVIFSVVYDSLLNVISSTSDDRTVRIWRVENKNVEYEKEIDWENCNVCLTITMYGHTARVWRSVIRNEKIISIGEDSLMCVWSLDGKLLDKLEIHNGAKVWSIDVSDDDENIFTGGADGAVNVWPLKFKDSPLVTPIYSDEDGKIPKFVFYTRSDNIIIFMDGGSLIIYNHDFKTIMTSLNLSRYSNYCVMQISPDRRKIGLGSKDGYLEIYEILDKEHCKLAKIMETKVTETKILSFHWLSDEMILVCGEAGQLKLIDKITKIVNIGSTFVLPTSRERWTTAAIIYENFLICGDRAGSVYTFNLVHDIRDSLPTQVFPKIHGRLGVQSFKISGNKILSTGRDGTLKYYEFNEETKDIRTLHHNKMPMDWVCKILEINDDLYVLGFKEVELMIYSMNLKRIVKRFICGGGHRSWDLTISNEKIDFLYIRDKRVYELESTLKNVNLPILNGHHTKEIYCIELIENLRNRNVFISASEDCTLRLTSIVRDEKSKIHKYLVKNLGTYNGHISNVRSLAILNLTSNENFTKNLVVSGGGRAQLKIWEIELKIDEGSLKKENVNCRELFSYMLRGTDKERKKNCQTIQPSFFVDPETRIMDIKIQFYRNDKNLVIIFLACSDGFLRILLYNIIGNILYLSDTVNYCDRCTLRINNFIFKNEIILMTMTTDGTISFWLMTECIENLIEKSRESIEKNIKSINRPFSNIKIHQSGINSFDFRKIDDSRLLIFTGGDDNLLSLVVVEISTCEDKFFARQLASWNSSSIHSAQITGAKFIDENRMLSTGIDQRVFVYSYIYEDGKLSISQIDETITLVPDVQGVALCQPIVEKDETLVCVYGKGLEVLILKHDTQCL